VTIASAPLWDRPGYAADLRGMLSGIFLRQRLDRF
jgi:hypothetical protein